MGIAKKIPNDDVTMNAELHQSKNENFFIKNTPTHKSFSLKRNDVFNGVYGMDL